MNEYYPMLFSPIRVGSVTLKNRIEVSPMAPAWLGANVEHYRHDVARFERYAMGGAGLITVGEVATDDRGGRSGPRELVITHPNYKTMLHELADSITMHGAASSIEVSHAGLFAKAANNNGVTAMGPCDGTAADGEPYRAMTEEDMNAVADSFAEAFSVIKAQGFTMGMVHCGHGWLISQFLSPLWNHRTDEYGGSLENRARFPIMILDRIRQKVGKNYPISIRISGDEFVEGGFTLEDCVAFCKMIEDKVDLIHVSVAYLNSPSCRMVMPVFYPAGKNLPIAAEIRKNVKIPVTAIGALNTPEIMEKALEDGMCDMVAGGREAVADPFYPSKAQKGHPEEIDHCIRCYMCVAEGMLHGVRRCTVNPVYGKEYENKFAQLPTVSKNVVVIGGGPGGMKAAITAADRGHSVTLIEKKPELGGALDFSDHIWFKQDIAILKNNLIRQVQNRNIAVMTGTTATPELVKSLRPDAVIAAVGATPNPLRVPGADRKNVIFAKDMFNPEVSLGKQVVIIGGGLVGCEAALQLTHDGHEVTIVEMLPTIANDAMMEHKLMLLERIERECSVITGAACLGIEDNGVRVRKEDADMLIKADSVIVSVGYTANDAEASAFLDCCDFVRRIGDCNASGKIGAAIRYGYYAAMDI